MDNWKPDEVGKKALSGAPRMFASIAIPFIKRYGEAAKTVLSNIMYESGLARGQELGAKAKDRNDLVEFERLNIEDYIEQGDNTPGFDDPARKWVKREKNHIIFNLSLCGGCESNIPLVWQEMGLDAKTIRMLGEIYCEPFDKGVRKGFNPNIKLTFTKLAPRGDPYCEWDESLPEEK